MKIDKGQVKILLIMGAIIVGLILFIVLKDNMDFISKEIDGDVVKLESGDLDNDECEPAKEGEELEQESEVTSIENIKIYITGQVKNPGVIEIPSNFRLNEAVDIVGGFLPDADLIKINLAIRVEDEGMYYIPKIGEESPEIPNMVTTMGDGDGGKVNINTADQGQLETLPRIGPVLANSIIDYRNQNGSFRDITDIKNVSGIGDKTFDGLKELIIVK